MNVILVSPDKGTAEGKRGGQEERYSPVNNRRATQVERLPLAQILARTVLET